MELWLIIYLVGVPVYSLVMLEELSWYDGLISLLVGVFWPLLFLVSVIRKLLD